MSIDGGGDNDTIDDTFTDIDTNLDDGEITSMRLDD